MSYDAGTIGTAGEAPSRSALARASDTIQAASRQIGGAVEAGRQPGMPLDLLGKLTREAPISALIVAFLLGVLVARG
jgi:hypothetical protein